MTVELPNDPARQDVLDAVPTFWSNPLYKPGATADNSLPISSEEVMTAQRNWKRLAPLLERCFPELAETGGAIRSELVELKALRQAVGYGGNEYGRIFIKADSALPVAGSIKARGGVYEVFLFAEQLAKLRGILADGDPITRLADVDARALFSDHTVAVGSTGNLGLSVGIAARALGFKATVHMSSDAKRWKVERLIRLGVDVIQHEADYTTAVEQARVAAEGDPSIYFVDDEQSRHLFFGYSVAALELAEQLRSLSINVDPAHPLFLYLPCGIGGAPGGVTYGAKVVFGDSVHCFFVEPVQSPCALVHLMSGSEELVSVYDVGLTNRTEADGMAVARMSGFVARVMKNMLAGVFTVSDDDLFRWVLHAHENQNIRLEPSAAAGMAGPHFVLKHPVGREFVAKEGLEGHMTEATHIVWTTGGSFVPQEQFEDFLGQAKALT
ncbi:D-serine ammonia-lyase [Pararhizobium sp. BT-229]|uniref:D-serine ammonia-lyase n=1 Tax=Pararhizobium sp. BT-229 TaxID=2986923 RepID=UPI0021F7E1DF|nr:D-serine ammonia-lyase [Pararhizobium sp. BT-229]MCV9962571.1 D-serine ammonia-lyase [Pararhizobium sp. BT-229]